MNLPEQYVKVEDGPTCNIKLKPPKFPKNLKTSKRVYKEAYFIRPLGAFKHIYDVKEGIYIVSLFKEYDEQLWLDNNEEKIKERICKILKY